VSFSATELDPSITTASAPVALIWAPLTLIAPVE
jgi:hypothetical protein